MRGLGRKGGRFGRSGVNSLGALEKNCFGFHVVGIRDAHVADRAHGGTSLGGKKPHALGTERRVEYDLVFPPADAVVGTALQASSAIDACVRDHRRHSRFSSGGSGGGRQGAWRFCADSRWEPFKHIKRGHHRRSQETSVIRPTLVATGGNSAGSLRGCKSHAANLHRVDPGALRATQRRNCAVCPQLLQSVRRPIRTEVG